MQYALFGDPLEKGSKVARLSMALACGRLAHNDAATGRKSEEMETSDCVVGTWSLSALSAKKTGA